MIQTLAKHAVFLAIPFFAMTCLAAPGNPEIRREGSAEHVAKVGAMELKPFPADLWSSLSDWQPGSAPNPAIDFKGKVVLILTWTAWAPSSQQALNRAAELAFQHKDSLVVIPVHTGQRHELATGYFKDHSIALPLARDAEGKFRAGLASDGDPDVYLIDRAGNLRFADIESSSVAAGVELLVKETAESAAAVPSSIASAQRQAQADAGKTRSVEIGGGNTLRYAPPPASAYAQTLWPKVNDPERAQTFAALAQGQPFPGELPASIYLDRVPQLPGKVIVAYFWKTRGAVSAISTKQMNDVQRSYRGDIAVIGIAGAKGNSNVPQDDRSSVERYLRTLQADFFPAFDEGERVSKALSIADTPVAFVMSTDGVVRWQGNPADQGFRNTIDRLIEIDPGVLSRRADEAKALGK